MARSKARKARIAKRMKKRVSKKTNLAIKRAAKDGKVTRKELKRIVRKSKGTRNTKNIVKKIKRTKASVPKMFAKHTRKFIKKIRAKRKGNPTPTPTPTPPKNKDKGTPTPTPTPPKKGGGDGKDKGTPTPTPTTTPTPTPTPPKKGGGDGKGKGGGGGGSDASTPVSEKNQQKDDINAADELDSKKYQKFDYKKALKEGADRARDRNSSAKGYKPKALFGDEAEKNKKKWISRRTGAKLNRINKRGKLQLKEGQKKAMAPSYKKYQEKIANTETPYAKLLGKIGTKTGVKYGAAERKKRTQMRLRKLKNKLSTDNPIGSTMKKLSGYGDAGTDLIKMFTKAKGLSK